MAFSKFLGSPYLLNSHYTKEQPTTIKYESGSYEVLDDTTEEESGDISSLPINTSLGSHDLEMSLEDNGEGGKRLFLSQDGGDSDVEFNWIRTVDLSDYDTLKIYVTDTGGSTGRDPGSNRRLALLRIDGTIEHEGGVDDGELDIDVSGYSGEVEIKLGLFNGGSSHGHEVTWDEMRLE